MTVVAAAPWTYWLAPGFLVIAAVVLLGFGVTYLRKVVEPHCRYLDAVAPTGIQRSVRTSAQLALAPVRRRLAA